MRTDALNTILTRRSIRSFSSKPVSDEQLRLILEAARHAPSAGNCQARDIIVVKDAGVRKQLSAAALGQKFIEEAQLVLVVCANTERSGRRYGERGRLLYCLLDAAASVENILLAVNALKLGACWVGAFHDDLVCRILNLPKYLRPIAIIPIGFPAEPIEPITRMPLKDFVHVDKYGLPFREDPFEKLP